MDIDKSEIQKELADRLNETVKHFSKSDFFSGNTITNILNIEACNWIKRIEDIRAEMQGSTVVLDGWARPWLDRSKELSSRRGIEGGISACAEEGMLLSQAVRSSKPIVWCLYLYELIRFFRPRIVIEIGTNVGISGAYLAAALKEAGRGCLVTLEGSPSKAAVAKKIFKQLDLDDMVKVVVGDFDETFSGVLDSYGEQIDFAFVDGFHDSLGTLGFHRQLSKKMKGGIIVYDDIRWSKEMLSAWNEIKSNACVNASIDLENMGVCLLR